MNRRIFVTGCLAGAAGSAGAATSAATSTRWAEWRRKVLRSHVAVLLIVGVVVGAGAWRHGRKSAPEDRIPPWERK